jgi:hypothetical protein
MSEQVQSIAAAFEPLLPQVSPEEIPMVIAILERVAATHYRNWAEDAENNVERDGLLACAAREDEIASFIESLESDSQARAAELHRRFPDFEARYEAVMAGKTRTDQLRIQAEGELGGAGYMSQFAAATEGAVSARFESLACCEEANSKFLSRLIDA